MSRLFGRGELQAALLDAIGALGPSHGYAIMQTLAERVGNGWRPSPGAIYPALLGLEDAGLIRGEDGDGSRVYSLTQAGERANESSTGTIDRVAARAQAAPPRRRTIGALLEDFVGSVGNRGRQLSAAEEAELETYLGGVRDTIDAMTTRGTT
jgi:DNA-binding PadR family transcriptional regulator